MLQTAEYPITWTLVAVQVSDDSHRTHTPVWANAVEAFLL